MTERLRRPLAIRSGAVPFQISVLLGAFLGGVLGAISPETRSQALSYSFSPAFVVVFNLLIAGWSAVALSGLLPELYDRLRHRLAPTLNAAAALLHARLRREQVGLIGFSGTAVTFGYSIMAYTGAHGASAALWTTLFGLVSCWRCIEIRNDLRKLDASGADPRLAHPPALGEPDNGGR